MSDKKFFVYIMAKKRNSTFYVGVTSDLRKRIWEHKNGVEDGFTKQYDIKNLVYYEVFDDPENAIKREKRLKKWNRAWKMRVIEEMNPDGTIFMMQFVCKCRMPAVAGMTGNR